MKQIDLIPLWKAMADPKRLRIVQLLHETSRTTSEISAHFDVSRFATMQHLKVLEQAGLIKTRREGRQRWNFLNEELFLRIQQAFLDDETDGEYRPERVLSFLARKDVVPERDTVESGQGPIEMEVTLRAAPARVFKAITKEIDDWWFHRIQPNSKMLLEADVGGRLYEAFDGGGGALYGHVTYLKPDQAIRLSGSMGLVNEGDNHLIHIELRRKEPDDTLLRLKHRFLRRVDGITVDTFKRSWIELLAQHLKPFVE